MLGGAAFGWTYYGDTWQFGAVAAPVVVQPVLVPPAIGPSVKRLQAMVPLAVWGDPTSLSWMQTAARCLGAEIQTSWDAVTWIKQQAFPALADANGLAYWEQLLGVPINPPNLSTEERRSVVLARRAIAGAVQIPRIQALIAQYQHGQTLVTWTPLTATLTVTWMSILGVPTNLADVDVALREYLPAWITINYAYLYTTWSQITATGRTWDQITADGLTWTQLLTTPAGSL